MREGWEMKKLGEVCEIKHGYAFKGSDFENNFSGSKPIVLTPGNFSEEGGLYFTNKNTKRCINGYPRDFQFTIGDLVVVMTDLSSKMKILGMPAIIRDQNILHNQRIGLFSFLDNSLNKNYLFYYLQTDGYLKNIKKTATGTMVRHTAPKRILDNKILIPPLSEQQQIVSILDKTFAAIDEAKANTEKNLNNAKELFQSQLNKIFSEKGEGWVEKKLGECFRLKSGDLMTTKMMNNAGIFPVYGGNGIAGYHDEYNLSGSNIIVGRVGALCGNVRHVTEKVWLTDNAFQLTDFRYQFDHSFLAYLLNFKNLRSLARQAAQPVISNSSLKDILLQFPQSIQEQQKIVSQLNALSAETKKLEAHYQKKSEQLEDLKKSILEKAFKGELSERKVKEMVE